MDTASDEDWPVERLASVSGVSDAHFARSFKEAFGVPPHRYLLTRRIERVKALLRDSDAPIIEIAFQTGWNSLGTFGRVFRDVTGGSPSDFRARAGERPSARPGAALLRQCCLQARPQNRSFGEAAARGPQ
jgi:transcriptional regulator GlxA family with amidase domain